MENKTALSTKILATIGELAVIASLFPYQITVNRKEKSIGVRSLLVSVRSEKQTDDEGKSSRVVKFNMPGFAFREAAKAIEGKFSQKKTKKKLVLRKKVKNPAQNENE